MDERRKMKKNKCREVRVRERKRKEEKEGGKKKTSRGLKTGRTDRNWHGSWLAHLRGFTFSCILLEASSPIQSSALVVSGLSLNLC